MRRNGSEADVNADGSDDMVLTFQLRRRGEKWGL